MGGRNFTLSLWTSLLILSAASSMAVSGSTTCEQQLTELTRRFVGYQTRTLVALKEISHGDQLWAPSTRLENQFQRERAVHERQKKDLITGSPILCHK